MVEAPALRHFQGTRPQADTWAACEYMGNKLPFSPMRVPPGFWGQELHSACS